MSRCVLSPPDPLVLAFDTSAAHCAAALLSGGQIVASRFEEMDRGQAERLMPLLEELLTGADRDWSQIDRIGVCVGPGNFTGIRISVSAARGLSLGLGIPAVGVSLFETTQSLGNQAQTCVPAPRGKVYWFDPETQTAPVLSDTLPERPFAISTDHSPSDHVAEIARIAAGRLVSADQRPAPLYIRPADAAPPKQQPPLIHR